MFKPGNPILFATDLTPNCQPALEYTIAMGIRFHSPIHLLHVIEPLPETYESHLKGLLGKHKWEEVLSTQKNEVRQSLLGKKATGPRIKEQIQEFCKPVGDSVAEGDPKSWGVIISSGETVEEILKAAIENECCLIVLGAPEGFVARNAIGKTIKEIAAKSPIPLTIVPSKE